MWQEKLEEIKQLNSRFGERLNDGATDEELKMFLEEVSNQFDETKLQPYISFLKIINGFEFNGFIIYGTDSKFLKTTPKQQINGFIDNNLDWNDLDWDSDYVFLGDSSISWYVLDLGTGKYCELDKPSGDVMEEFENIDLLINKILDDALI